MKQVSTLPKQIQIGISACLLGDKVRFDGGHKKDDFLTNRLSQFFEFVKLCPEVEIGLGIPRTPIRLQGSLEEPRLVQFDDPSKDYTDTMAKFAEQACKSMQHLSGYILKNRSPTCGMERVKVYKPNKQVSKTGVGIFAKVLLQNLPALPVEEEGRLHDAKLRDNFLERVFVYRRWQELQTEGITKSALIDFHTRHKLILMAHKPTAYKALGQAIADLKSKPLKAFTEEYILELMQALRVVSTHKKQTNVLQHCAGYLKRDLDSYDKQELHNEIMAYYHNKVPLVVPITLLNHYIHKLGIEYLQKQYYLNPYPRELIKY